MYSATKAALLAFARNLSLELLERRIRVNAVSPGPVATSLNPKMFEKLGMSAEAGAQAAAGYAEMVPMKRVGEPKEIATVVAFLASDDSSFVVGEEIIVGGGIATLQAPLSCPPLPLNSPGGIPCVPRRSAENAAQ